MVDGAGGEIVFDASGSNEEGAVFGVTGGCPGFRAIKMVVAATIRNSVTVINLGLRMSGCFRLSVSCYIDKGRVLLFLLYYSL